MGGVSFNSTASTENCSSLFVGSVRCVYWTVAVLGMATLGDGCTGNGDCWEVSEYLGNSLLGSNQNMGKNQFIGE